MDITRRNFLLGSAALIGSLGLYGCGHKKQNDNTSIEAALAYSSDNLSPIANTSALGIVSNWYVYEGLYNLDYRDNKIYNGLAALNPIKIDDTHYEVVLEDDARFSDGSIVTIEDVVNSFNSNKSAPKFGNMLAPILDISKKDAKTAVVHTSYNCQKVLKEILSLVNIYSKDNLGTGPWVYKSISLDKIEFSPNSYYNGKFESPYKFMTFHINEDDNARANMLVNDQVSIIENADYKYSNTFDSVKAKIDSVPSSSSIMVKFNIEDINLRKAIMFALDEQTIIEQLYQGHGSGATCLLPKYHESYKMAKQTYNHDINSARKCLKNDTAISVKVADGLPVEFSRIVKDSLDEVGIAVNFTEGDAQIEIFCADVCLYTNLANNIFAYWYGDNQKIMDLLKQDKIEECINIASEELSIYPLLFKDHVIAYYPDKVRDYTNINPTGLYFASRS